MAQIYRLNVEAQNCWKCEYFRRDNLSDTPNQGSCTADAPRARDAVSDANNQDDTRAQIEKPSTTYCGSFVPWTGEARVLIPVLE